jgi:hypothetical protein
MALGIEEERNLRDLLNLFFPEDRTHYEQFPPNEHTLEERENMIIAINSCSLTAQRFIEDLAGNRMIKGFLRKSLTKMLHALKGKDAKYVGTMGCTGRGQLNFRSAIKATVV